MLGFFMLQSEVILDKNNLTAMYFADFVLFIFLKVVF